VTDTGRLVLGEPGRSAEARVVEDFLASASTAPSVLVIEGDPGIGKTTLWLSALDRARERGFAVLAAWASATDSVLAYTSLADLLADARLDATPLPDPQRLAIDRILLRANTDDQPTDQRTVAAAFLSTIQILAEASPVLVAVDDLQWLDTASAHAIGFAARRATGRVGLLATFRTNSHRDRPPSWFAPAPPAELTRIRLGPLSVGALHGAVSRRLGRSLSRPQISRIYEVSAGNPFYAIELARTLLDQPPGAQVSMPATLMDLVHTRIAMLDPAVRETLLAVACVGTPTIGDVAYAIGSDADHVVGLLEVAETQAIVEISGNRVQFTHPLLARGCYDDATPAQRRAMHRRLAELVSEPELRARHLALSDLTGEPQTLDALDSAARRARRRGAPQAAAEFLDMAIRLGGDTPKRRIRSARNHLDAGDSRLARTLLTETISALPPGGLRAEALHMLAVVSLYDDSFVEAADILERALGEVGDQLALRVQTLVTLAFTLLNVGDMTAALATVDQAVTAAERLGHPQLLSQALSLSVHLRFRRGDGLDQSSLQRALELEDREAFMPAALRPGVQNALLLAWSGELGQAYEEMTAWRRRCREHGEEGELIHVVFNIFQIEVWRGNFAQATQHADDAMESALQLGGGLALGTALTMRATLAAYAGDEQRAREQVAAALAASQRCGAQLLAQWPIVGLGFLEVSLGNCAAALKTLAPLLSGFTTGPGGTEISVASFLPDAVEALIGLDRVDETDPLVAALESNGRRLDRAWMLAVGARCRAMLLAARGDLAAATAAAQTAMTEHDRLPMPFERARTQLLLGQLQRRQRHRDVAGANMTAALGVFDELDTPLWSAKARASLARSDISAGPAKLLTTGERQVAELAASGMTNREVAAALYISPKTVEAHLTHIYRKLDVRTRAELVRRIDRLDL
jgi:DNA-binding CsgD family transcriptional regulator/tetratricopeptide (TPR) repeat protein